MGKALAGGLRRAVRRADVMAALMSPTTGAALGLSAVLAAAAFVAEQRGVLGAGAWWAGAAAGLVWVLVAAAVAGFSASTLTAATARQILLHNFGSEVGKYPETARPVRALIETRLRLAEAVETASAPQRRVALRIETAVDAQIVVLVGVARKAARHRAGLQFHTAMADAAEQRREGDGLALSGQRAAARDLSWHAEAERIILEEGVAALSELVTRVTLALAKGQTPELDGLATLAEDLLRRASQPVSPDSLPDL